MANGFFSYYRLPISQDVGWVEYCDIRHPQGNYQLNPTYFSWVEYCDIGYPQGNYQLNPTY